MEVRNGKINIISDDESEETNEVVIISDSDSNEEVAPDVVENVRQIIDRPVVVPVIGEENWWEKLMEPVLEKDQCKIKSCKFAPPGHKFHPRPRRKYSVYEIRLIIQYLIHHKVIHLGKGLKVWENMHLSGYLLHRPVQSLNNHFKKSLLRDIRMYNLPEEIEIRFLSLTE